ncbi:rod shape-determining protein RodA [Burkholderiaceae bacterium DAT-1]|nr:rod shape-determining protein RodA [Burkholderiaceae bacterium DAT-1]
MIQYLWQKLTHPLDKWLMLFLGLIFSVSLMTLYSASGGDLDKVFGKLASMAVAFTAMWLAAHLKPNQLMRIALPLYILGFILLLGVAIKGDTVNGAKRWLNIGITRIQPSELMKIAVPMTLAWFFQRFESHLNWRHFLAAALMIGAPAGLVVKQPDLGTGILISAAGFYVLFLAGLSWRVILPLILAGVIGGWFVSDEGRCTKVFRQFQCDRVQILIDPEIDPLGKGFHTIQGTTAVGSGGIIGKGWQKGTQSQLGFIPERTTDFIFAVYSEEFGLLGGLLLIVLYVCVIGRGMVIAAKASTLFGRLLAGAITMSFFTYAFVNMGMVSGILPVVGVPLPLISYGGTAMLAIMIGMGILMSIQGDRKLMKR